jgi:hypothetical protein
MDVSRLTCHTHPGKTHEVVQELQKLRAMARQSGAVQPRVLRNHFASHGVLDVVFEQEALDLETLETQIHQVTEHQEFRQWSEHMSGLLAQSPKREMSLLMPSQCMNLSLHRGRQHQARATRGKEAPSTEEGNL